MATEAKQTAPSDYDEKVGSPGLHDVDTSRGVRKTGSDSLSDLDTYLEGSEGVTVRDLETYRHVADTLPYTAWLVAFVEFAERWTYYGTTNLYSNYIRAGLPKGSRDGSVVFDRENGVAGALGQGQQKAFAIRTFNSFFVYVTPWVGAILADTRWGRYKTIMVFSLVCLAGHIILVGSATPQSLENINGAVGLLVLSIIVMGLGAGAIKSNVSPLIAEQYTGKLRKEILPSGETVIKSPALTYQSIYLYFYAAINLGSAGSISASFLARDHGYWTAFLVPTCIFCAVPFILAVGKKHYVVTPPRGSILLETVRVIRMAMKPAWSLNPRKTHRAIKANDFWDVARPSHYPAGDVPAHITWDDEFVGEVARTCNACAVFLFFPIFWLCYSQIDGNLATVAASMKLNGTPNDLIQNLNPISIVIMVPLMDKLVYPFLRKRGINFSPIKRIFTGFIVAGIAMLYAGVLQHFIFKESPCHDNQPSECLTAAELPNPANINVWIVSGPYILVGLAEIFASITSLEYAFTKAPKRMKSVVMAFSQFQTALSSALNFAFTELNKEEKFTWLFGVFGIAAWIAGGLFLFTFWELDKREAQLNAIGTGEREGFAGEDAAMTVDPSSLVKKQ
ncbi:peptide transporter PTR2B [Pterulicium gracile]|uniref:Peptide transporter PTR2B n=1 Tax=Pterulicium gracile TaxID=1884261 RepID=A0A5C3Q135_9AGAR|nr:peptide transporter PTR2B [Pterula gracilis]